MKRTFLGKPLPVRQWDADYADARGSCDGIYLRVRARISWHFGASAGQADARRRDAGDVVISSRSGNAADTRLSPPRPAGLRLPRPANHCGFVVMIQLGMGAAQQNAKLFLREP